MKAVKNFLDSDAGTELRNYILEQYFNLLDITKIDDKGSSEKVALEFKANKKAAVILRNILDNIMSVPDERGLGKDGYYSL